MSGGLDLDLERWERNAADFATRLVETSTGWVLLEPHLIPGDDHEVVNLSVFGRDGWSTHQGAWPVDNDRYTSLGATLAVVCRIPSDEAERIANVVLEEWRARGGVASAREVKGTVSRLLALFVVVGSLAVLGLALGIWELARLLS